MFKSLLMSGVLATVQSFDGSANILSLTLPTERGGGHITVMILDALHAKTNSNPCPMDTVKTDQVDSSTSTTAAPDCPDPSIPETPKVLESTTATTGPNITSEPTPQTQQQEKDSAESDNGWSEFHSVIVELSC